MIQNSFKMESKYMKTSGLIAWKCKLITYRLLIFRLIQNMYMILYHSNKCAINMRVWENGEEGMREQGDVKELKCMKIQLATKNPSSIPNYSSKFPLHKPTWKGIQLPRNWFTSRESEHSSCNGQAKSFQNAKGQLKNDQNIFSFLMKSFINFIMHPKVEFPSMSFLQLILVVQ